MALTRRYGRGQITFLAADPALAPLHDWPDIQVLYRALLIEGPYAPAIPFALQDDSAAGAASLFGGRDEAPRYAAFDGQTAALHDSAVLYDRRA